MLPASAIRRTGWGTVEDILDQPWDFPCRSIYGNPQSERILACMPGGVLKCEQGEESGAANSPSPRCSGDWEGTMAEVQLHHRPGWLLPSGALQPMSCAKPFSDQPGASHTLQLLTHGFKPQAHFSYQPISCHICVMPLPYFTQETPLNRLTFLKNYNQFQVYNTLVTHLYCS